MTLWPWTKAETANGLRWVRDEAGALIATFWLIIVLFAIGGWIAYSFFQIDAEFSRPLAGGVMPPEVTQHLSWAILAFSIAGGPAIIWCHMHAMPKFQKLLIVLDALAAILLILHAYGIASKVMEGQYHKAAAIVTVNESENTSNAATIAILQAQQEGIRTDRDARVARLQKSIDNITNDGLNNDHLADNYRADQEKAEEEAKTAIAEIDAKILKLTEDTGTKNVQATTDAAETDSFNPLFTLMARAATWTWDPAETPADPIRYACGVFFFTLFFGLGKLLMMTLFTIAYAMMLVARVKARERKGVTDTVEVDKARLAELEEREANAKQAGKKAARTRRRGNKIEQTEQYARDKIAAFMELKNKGVATSDIAKQFGLTVASMKVGYEQYMTPEEYNHLFNNTAVAVVDPQPAPEPEPEATDSSGVQAEDDSEDEDDAAKVAAE